METEAMKQGTDLYLSDESVILTQPLIDQFLHDMKACGRQSQTIQAYQHNLQEFYAFLPSGKKVTKEILAGWRETLKESGYSINTVNTKVVAVNGLLKHCGAKALCLSHEKAAQEDLAPELTRSEYQQLLSTVYQMRREREYLLIKVFACTGLQVSELHCLTVESIKNGVILSSDGKEKILPDSLRFELLHYANHKKIKKGSIFLTRSGKRMDRSNITNAIRRLAEKAGLEPERCNPRSLRRMYHATHEEIIENLEPYYVKSYDKLLNMEQSFMDWD